VQLWLLTAGDVCKADLSDEEYAMVSKAVLESDIMDAEILGLLERRPKAFHVGLLPSCSKGAHASDFKDTAAAQVTQALRDRALADLKVFEAELKADQVTLAETKEGSLHLQDLPRWIELDHRRDQAAKSKALAEAHMAKFSPPPPVSSARGTTCPGRSPCSLRQAASAGASGATLSGSTLTPPSRATP
jgi:hypothetical protein